MAGEPLEKARFYCNRCGNETNHELKGAHSSRFDEENGGFLEVIGYKFWTCMGCEHGLLQQSYWNNMMDDNDEEYTYFPACSRGGVTPKDYSKLKPKLEALYKEAITAYNHQAFILCAAGLRALIEGICQNKRIKGRNLKIRIDGLSPLLPHKRIIRNLHQFRFMGNEAVHELAAPKPYELRLAIEVIEDLLNFFYELDHKASQLRYFRQVGKVRPRRKKPAAASAAPTTTAPVVAGVKNEGKQ
jgi:hypothetical protein